MSAHDYRDSVHNFTVSMDNSSTMTINLTRYLAFLEQLKFDEGSTTDITTLKFVSWHIYVVLACINTLCHGAGSWLLMLTYKRRQTPQHLFLVNLSATELLRNIARMVICALFILEGGETLSTYSLWTVYITTITYLYFSAMFLITADRFFATFLSFRHKIICTPIRTKWLIAGVWGLVLVVTISVSAYFHSVYGILWMYVCDKIHHVIVYRVITILTLLYLISVIVCYLLMFLRYTKSKRSTTDSHLSKFQMFKESKFYVSALLISSFLLLQVIPYAILVTNKALPYAVRMVLNILSELSDTIDFVIYVFMYKPVFELLKRHWRTMKMKISAKGGGKGESSAKQLVGSHLTMTWNVSEQEIISTEL